MARSVLWGHQWCNRIIVMPHVFRDDVTSFCVNLISYLAARKFFALSQEQTGSGTAGPKKMRVFWSSKEVLIV